MKGLSEKQKAELWRAKFFGRQDVYGKQKISADGKKNFYPVCKNFWSDGCHIKLKDGKGCAGCDLKQHEPVSNESVLRHIKGDEQQIQYVLHLDGTIRFCAMDFDCKPGKEAKGYTFEDVAKVLQVCKEWGINYGVARSTGEGYHVYFFFDRPYPANKARAVMIQVFEAVGFMDESRLGGRQIPEIFPKQTSGGVGDIGNGIKPPMIENRFEAERNCWVNDENSMIPPNVQWDYFGSIANNTPDQWDTIIAKYEIPVYENAGSGGGSGYRSSPSGQRRPGGKWQPPLTGSMEKVVEACPAFRNLMSKVRTGYNPGHDEGFALYWAAMKTAGGMEWFRKNVPGWGKNEGELRQLEQSVAKNYSALTCRAMQDRGVCVRGTKCMEKKPPKDMVDGELVVMHDVPKEEWPDPSPIRYAYGPGEEFLAKLQAEVEEVAKETDLAVKSARVKDLIYRCQVFDDDQQKALRGHMETQKVASKADLKRMFKEAQKNKSEELKEIAKEREDTISAGATMYIRSARGGYSMYKTIKGSDGPQTIDISDFEIDIVEVRKYRDDGEDDKTVFICQFKTRGFEQMFEIDSEVWADNNKLFLTLVSLCPLRFNSLISDMSNIRQASQAFSLTGAKHSQIFLTQGWYDNTYLMPAVQVDLEGVKPNTERQIYLDGPDKQLASQLGFKMLNEAELRATLFHLKSELFKTYPRKPLFMTLAHTLQAGFHRHLGIRVKPTLWVEGGSGAGKSTMMFLCQQFWGDFTTVANWGLSAVGASIIAHHFKDAALTIDDYKGTKKQVDVALQVVQYFYEQTSRVVAKRDGTQRALKDSRTLLMVSGEDAPFGESSSIARLILVPYPKNKQSGTLELVPKCEKASANYSGVTPWYLHFYLNQDRSKLQKRIDEIKKKLSDEFSEVQNAVRMAGNLAINYLAWELFVDFMKQRDIVDEKEAQTLKDEHYQYVRETLEYMVSRCEGENVGKVFLEILSQQLESGECAIRSLEGYNNEHVDEVGFVRDKDETPDTVYLYHRIVYDRIVKAGESHRLSASLSAIGEQLKSIGAITDHDKGTSLKSLRANSGSESRRYWAVKLSKLGLSKNELKVVGGTQQIHLPPGPEKDADGLI